MLSLVFATALHQGPPARVAVLEATVDKKTIGEVTYVRQVMPGKGIEKSTVFSVDENDQKYTIREKRTFDMKGNPQAIERTYTEDGETLSVTVNYRGNIVDVTYAKGGDMDKTSVALTDEKASTLAVSETWFLGSAPKEGTSVEFWEYDIDAANWQKRKVTYHGKTDLKWNDEIIKVHRISIGSDVDIYVDDTGLPYKLSDKTVKGGLTLLRKTPSTGGF